MRCSRLLAALLSVTGTGSLAAEQQIVEEPVISLRSSQTADAKLIEVAVPGPLVEVEPFQSPSGQSSLVMLVEPVEESGGPRFIYLLRLGEDVELSDLPVVVPAGVDSLAVTDLDDDGAPELLVGEHGRIFRLAGEGSLEVALEGEGIDLKGRARSSRDGSTVDSSQLVLGGVGRVRRFNSGSEEGNLREVEGYRIPVRAELQGSWLRLASPLVTALPKLGLDREFTYIVGPEAIGDRRLRTLILEPAGDSDEGPVELWSQLPSPEKVEESQYAVLDDEIVLLVTTIRADRIGIFEKEKLRVLRLSEDRSRAGAAPILEVESRTRNWYRPSAGVFDVNRDGSDDVILVQPKGLGAGKLVIEAFIGSGSGTFDRKTRKTILEVETETWNYGQDIDLDGLPDLVLIVGETLRVHTGVDEMASRLVVHQEPQWSVPIGEVDDLLQVRDVQGDQRPEVLLIARRGSALQTATAPEDDETDASEGDKEPTHGRLSLIVFSSPDHG